jgi:hypothetical protein
MFQQDLKPVIISDIQITSEVHKIFYQMLIKY